MTCCIKTNQTPQSLTSMLKYMTVIPEKVVLAHLKLVNPYTVTVLFTSLKTCPNK